MDSSSLNYQGTLTCTALSESVYVLAIHVALKPLWKLYKSLSKQTTSGRWFEAGFQTALA